MGNCTSNPAPNNIPGRRPVVIPRNKGEILFQESDLWTNGDAPIVKVNGRGSLHLISISDSGNRPHVKGHIGTKDEYTEFLVGYSHFYHNYIFYWDGQGEATFETRSSRKMYSLGNMDNAVQVNRDGVFSRVIVKELNNPETASKLESTLYVRFAGRKDGVYGGVRGSVGIRGSSGIQMVPAGMQIVPAGMQMAPAGMQMAQPMYTYSYT